MKIKIVIKDSKGKELIVHKGDASKEGDIENLGKEALRQAREKGIDLFDVMLSLEKDY